MLVAVPLAGLVPSLGAVLRVAAVRGLGFFAADASTFGGDVTLGGGATLGGGGGDAVEAGGVELVLHPLNRSRSLAMAYRCL